MKRAITILERAGYTILFLLALTSFFRGYSKLYQYYRHTVNLVLDQGITAQAAKGEGRTELVGRNELIASLLDGIECDVRIGRERISCEEFHPALFDYGKISAEIYEKSYEFENGEIKTILFEEVEDEPVR